MFLSGVSILYKFAAFSLHKFIIFLRKVGQDLLGNERSTALAQKCIQTGQLHIMSFVLDQPQKRKIVTLYVVV